MSKTLLTLSSLFLSLSVLAPATASATASLKDCRIRSALRTLDGHGEHRPDFILGAIQERQKLTVAVRKELKPLQKLLHLSYAKGEELRKIQNRYMQLQKIERPSQEVLNELHDLDWKWKFLNQEMDQANNEFLTGLAAIYKKKGIPSTLVEEEGGLLVMHLDFSKPPTENHAFEFFEKIAKKFGLQKVTLSVKENAAHGFGGFFMSSAGRTEMGPDQAVALLQEYANSVSKHEGRHAMFFAKRNSGDDSIFHTQLHAQGDKLLNDKGMYDRYMSVEEIYTYSTDLQTLAQVFKERYVTDLRYGNNLLRQIEHENELLTILSKATSEVSEGMIKSLDQQISGKAPKQFQLDAPANGNFDLIIPDGEGRLTSMSFVSETEKRPFLKLAEINEKKGMAINEELTRQFGALGVKPEDLTKRAMTLEEQALMQKVINEFDQTPAGKKLLKATEPLIEEILVGAKGRLEKIKKVADHQIKEAEVLNQLMSKYAKESTLENLRTMRKQMFKMAKNVKEDYKGFILKQ